MDVGSGIEARELYHRFDGIPLRVLLEQASQLRDEGHGKLVTFSRKVFIPLTRLCRDVCAYCTFAKSPRDAGDPYLSPEQVLDIARAGDAAGCHEALFTLGDKPELRYRVARESLAKLGFATTAEYLSAICKRVLDETNLLPHVNTGILSEDEMLTLRGVSVSQGIMLETASARLSEPGGPHFGSPDKEPRIRLEMIEAAGRLRIPFTTGILIGIGENRLERIESLLSLKRLQERHGHLQEIIIQNFRAKSDTRFADHAEPDIDDLLWTAAVARIVFGPAMNIQVPPNLSYDDFPRLLDAGINDWGGISPVTADHVNPEAPWPTLEKLRLRTEAAGFALRERLAIYPDHSLNAKVWLDQKLLTSVLQRIDSQGLVREDGWTPGATEPIPVRKQSARMDMSVDAILHRAVTGDRLSEDQLSRLFDAQAGDVDEICDAADDLRAKASGDVVRYVVNRNINYTNVCSYHCQFCAFSKGKSHENLRGKPYDLALDEVARRAREAWDRGATEVCMQGGINPHYTGETYMELLRAVKSEVPSIHVHAFSPLEIAQGAAANDVSVHQFLALLQREGLGSLPGTAAEILDDEVRAVICPDKLSTTEWLSVVEAAHEIGLPTTATIMFGHMETTRSWSKHLLHLRDLQARTNGFTEFVPLPFVHMEAPMYLRGSARRGPTWREVRLMHAVARLALYPLINNIQASWVKLGEEGVRTLMSGGVNDLGGTLMNESISRAAGTQHGQELAPERMEALIASSNRTPIQRTTLYAPAPQERFDASFGAPPLSDLVMTPFSGSARRGAVG